MAVVAVSEAANAVDDAWAVDLAACCSLVAAASVTSKVMCLLLLLLGLLY